MTTRTTHALLCVALAGAGCERLPKSEQDAAVDVVRRNVRFLQEKKIDEMMETIHPQSPAFAPTRVSVTDLMKEYDLKCELTSLDVIGAKKEEVRVRFEQTTERKIGEVIEPRTRLTGVHVLRKDGAEWKIFDTEIISADVIDPLPEEPEPTTEKEPGTP